MRRSPFWLAALLVFPSSAGAASRPVLILPSAPRPTLGAPGAALSPLVLPAAASASPLPASSLHVKVVGPESAPPLVLIHGLDSANLTFNPVIPALAERFRVFAYDQRGHGNSPAPGDYTLDAMAADLAGLFDAKGLRDAHVVGHSFGARTALKFAELHPGRLRSLVIEDMETIPRKRHSPELLAAAQARADALRDFPREWPSLEALTEALRPWYGRSAEAVAKSRSWGLPNGTRKLLFRPDVSSMYSYWSNVAELTPVFAALDVPTLVLRALGPGGAITEEGISLMRRARRGFSLVEFPEATHNIHGSATQAWLAAVLPFLDGAESAARPAPPSPPAPPALPGPRPEVDEPFSRLLSDAVDVESKMDAAVELSEALGDDLLGRALISKLASNSGYSHILTPLSVNDVLGEKAGPRAIRPLLEAMRARPADHFRFEQRATSEVNALLKLGERHGLADQVESRIAELLLERARLDPSPALLQNVLWVLSAAHSDHGRFDAPEVRRFIVASLDHPDQDVRKAAASALEGRGAAAEILAALRGQGIAPERLAAVQFALLDFTVFVDKSLRGHAEIEAEARRLAAEGETEAVRKAAANVTRSKDVSRAFDRLTAGGLSPDELAELRALLGAAPPAPGGEHGR